jgi:fructokinase
MTTACSVVGEALVDLVESPSAPGTFTAHAGGSPYNVALTLGRLGQRVSLLARTGRDSFGRLLEDKARASGVAFDRWQVVAEPTSLAVASLDAERRAQYDFYLDGTAGLGWDDSVVDLMPTGGVLHLGSLASWRAPSAPVLQAMQKRAYETGDTLVSYDPNVRAALIADQGTVRTSIERCIGSAHVIKASDEDVAFLYADQSVQAVAARWCRLGAALVVVTLGASGAVAYSASGEISRRGGIEITVADTVGAGDSFAGGLLAALVDSGLAAPAAFADAVAHADARITDALTQAVLVSAITCERNGADPPTRAELDARLPALERG